MNLNRFQIQVATGRFTLPVVILICLFFWGTTWQEWSDWVSLAIIAAIGYLMIESNTAFNLIRTRTSLPVCIYWFFITSLFFLHPFNWNNVVPLAFLLAVTQLFRSYEQPHPAVSIYHSFLFVSLGSIAFPKFIYIVPLLWISMIPFRAINFKSFIASLLGIITPYWFLLAYAFCSDDMPLFLAPLQEMVQFHPIDFGQLTLPETVSWGCLTLLTFISGGHYWLIAYTDKTRTRIYHSFLIISGLWAFLFAVLQPQNWHILVHIQLISTAFLSGHLFTLTRNRFSGILFIVTFVVFFLLITFNLWMQFFNF